MDLHVNSGQKQLARKHLHSDLIHLNVLCIMTFSIYGVYTAPCHIEC